MKASMFLKKVLNHCASSSEETDGPTLLPSAGRSATTSQLLGKFFKKSKMQIKHGIKNWGLKQSEHNKKKSNRQLVQPKACLTRQVCSF